MNKYNEESSLRPTVVALYAILAAVVASAFLFEDEVKARIDQQFNSESAVVEPLRIQAQEDGPARLGNKIFLIDYMLPCETYQNFGGSVLGVTPMAEVEALIATDASFVKLASNDHMLAYKRGGFGAYTEQRISFFFDMKQILSGAIVNSPSVPLGVFASFIQDMNEWHGCLGIPSELHEDLPDNVHLDSLRFVYPTNMAVNIFVLSSPAVMVDNLVDFQYLISTVESEALIKSIFMEMVRGKKDTKGYVPDLRNPTET